VKSTIAVDTQDGEPQLSYEEVDTSLLPPRPRLYGLVGAEVIEEVWKARATAKAAAAGGSGNGSPAGKAAVAVGAQN
jgi:succinate dehydrogenase / fumarate reductase flavoprotein subunit